MEMSELSAHACMTPCSVPTTNTTSQASLVLLDELLFEGEGTSTVFRFPPRPRVHSSFPFVILVPKRMLELCMDKVERGIMHLLIFRALISS